MYSGIIHGDLNPKNILLQSAGRERRGFVAKVSDFGLRCVDACRCTVFCM